MKRKNSLDEFFEKQPPLSFLSSLTEPVHTAPLAAKFRTQARQDEALASGLFLDDRFPDPEGLLEVARADFLRFAEVSGISGDRYPIRLQKAKTPCFEAYRIEADDAGCTIEAEDTEGIRRALIRLEDEMTAREGALLPKGKSEHRPYLSKRITRGFFSPTNRPPKNGDELLDEIDYYPEEYLNRLAHDGTNGLWIYSSFAQLVPTEAVPERRMPGTERRIEKLNRVIRRCARYGISVYIFLIEPSGFEPELRDKYPECCGEVVDYDTHRRSALCPFRDRIRRYCYEAGYRLFTECPGLAGIIGITAGERPTVCSSVPKPTCADPCHLSRGEILAENLRNLAAGMHAAKPTAELVSWTYEHRNWIDPDILDYVRRAPSDVIQMQNFEDRGFAEQLGRERQAMDYWLSYPGPSGLFRMAAEEAGRLGKPIWAKMQICCSHEIATLPYIPTPYHVYEKMRGARELGVSGVMECWYFGNYPSLMSRFVGQLAFEPSLTESDCPALLRRLAASLYGESRADAVTAAWDCFGRGYSQYPLNIMFSYYSPAHDGVVWELALKPKNFSTSRSWLLTDRPDGDRICDALTVGHTLDEVITLFTEAEREYTRGLAILRGLGEADKALAELVSVSEALLLLARSTLDILRFYRLRDQLGAGEGDPEQIMHELASIVRSEMTVSHRMAELTEADGRLGYHSEAEGYKFFPEKLRARVRSLEKLLETEFPEVEERIRLGLPPLAYYEGEEEDCLSRIKVGGEAARIGESESTFSVYETEEEIGFEIASADETVTVVPEFRLFHITPPVRLFFENGACRLEGAEWSEHWPFYGERADAELAKWSLTELGREGGLSRVRLKIKKSDARLRGRAPWKLRIMSGESDWENEAHPIETLGKMLHSPGRFGWVFF